MFGTMGSLWLNSAQKIVFPNYTSEFQGLVAGAPVGKSEGEELGKWLGPFWVDRYGTDSRGGTYFRTYKGSVTSYGFAFQPNDQATPFGDTCYERRHLFGDWYKFSAKDGR